MYHGWRSTAVWWPTGAIALFKYINVLFNIICIKFKNFMIYPLYILFFVITLQNIFVILIVVLILLI